MYGAFDRYKILADVAPNSTEYKIWSKIARSTVRDDYLRQEMDEIQKRVEEQSKSHDFYNYNLLGKSAEYKNVTVKEVYNNGTFRIFGSENLFKIAGVESTLPTSSMSRDSEGEKSANELIKEMMAPGVEVTIAFDSNPYNMRLADESGSVNAAVFSDGESVAEALIDNGQYFKRKERPENYADIVATIGTGQRFLGHIMEAVSHTDLPLLSDRWLRIRSPLESYKAEYVYGTPYQTWSDVIGTYLMPALERSVSDPFDVVKSTAMFLAISAGKEQPGMSGFNKKALSGIAAVLDRGAFIGGTVSAIIKPNHGPSFEFGQRAGLALSVLGSMYTGVQTGSLEAMATFGQAGFLIGDFLDDKVRFKDSKLLTKITRDLESNVFRGKYALVGAAVGLAAEGAFGNSILGDRDVWIPERIQQRWEVEEYFDRLTYIKYMGLYNEAARKAKEEEGIDLDYIFRTQEAYKQDVQQILEDSDVNNTDYKQLIKRRGNQLLNDIKEQFGMIPQQNHRFEYSNGFSINDLPGVRNGVFYSDEVSEEERLYTLNALASMGTRYNRNGTDRTPDDRDWSQFDKFAKLYGTEIPKGYEIHHIVEFSNGGADDPSNLIALSPDDHLYITEQQQRASLGAFDAINIGSQTALRMGEYGRAALLYKKAAESTMYALKEDASWSDIIKALPQYERDYFAEFMKVNDPDEREEILRYASPTLRRALKQTWGMDFSKETPVDNDEYFQHHYLPNFLWEGWDADSDLNKVKAKFIKNEGMLYSDFGIYESTYRDPDVINAPYLHSMQGSQDPLTLQANLQATINGLGLTGEVSVEPKTTSGIRSVINLTKVVKYNIQDSIYNLF